MVRAVTPDVTVLRQFHWLRRMRLFPFSLGTREPSQRPAPEGRDHRLDQGLQESELASLGTRVVGLYH